MMQTTKTISEKIANKGILFQICYFYQIFKHVWLSKFLDQKKQTYHFLSEDGELQVEGGGWGRSGCGAAARVGAQALGQGGQSVGADGQHLHRRWVLAHGDLAPRQTDRLPLSQLHPVRDPGGGRRRRRLPPHLAGPGRHRGRAPPAARHLSVRPAIHAADTHTRQHSRRLS
jgi:hypothetical protein